MNRKDLRRMTGISSAAIAKMGKCENVNTGILLRICAAMKCDITEIMEIECEDSNLTQQEDMRNG